MPRFPDDVPTLADGGITLRAHCEADLPRIVEFAGDEVTRHWVAIPHPYAEQQAREFLARISKDWESGTSSAWAIETDGQFAGSINLKHRHDGVAEIGYGAHPAIRGRGVMTRAARLVVEHGFEELGLHTIVWRAGVGNFASRRVIWANGFRVDGTWPSMHTSPSGPVDLWIGHLHRDEPRTPAHPWFAPVTLEAENVRLRPWRETDRPPQVDDELRRFFLRGATSRPDLVAWCALQRDRMASGEGVFWCIADPTTDEALGHVQIIRLNQPMTAGSGMLGYFLDARARGRGVLQHALDALIPHAFSATVDGGLGLHRLEAGTDVDNTASQRTLRRAGFRLFSTERAVLSQPDGPPAGARSFELLASDDREAARIVPLPTPVLHTDRLTLRPWRASDRPRPDQRPDAASALYMPVGAQPISETFDDWLRRRRNLHDTGTVVDWCIADRATDLALGSIGVFGVGEGTPTNAEIGYWLHVEARRRGYLTEALAAVVTHAFLPTDEGGMGLTRLHAGTDLDNVASQQVLERAGFARWGVDHQAYSRSDGTPSDGAYYELLASDFGD